VQIFPVRIWTKLKNRLHSLFRKGKLDAEMAEEMRHHVELQTESNVKAGMNPDEAHYAALRQFGNVAVIQERARAVRSWVWLEQVGVDFRYALRYLVKTPRVSATAIASLALGLGIATALFSLLEARLLRPIAAKHPEELVLFHWLPSPGDTPKDYDFTLGLDVGETTDSRTRLHFSRELFELFSSEQSALTEVSAIAPLFASTVAVDGVPEFVPEAQLVSGNYYQMLGLKAWRGRLLHREDDLPGATPVCVVSYRYWQNRFAGAETTVGLSIIVNRVAVVVVGIAPPDFHGILPVGNGPEITVPLALASQLRRDPDLVGKATSFWLRLVGRRQPTLQLSQVQVKMEPVFRAVLQAQRPGSRSSPSAKLFVSPVGYNRSPGTIRNDVALFVPIVVMVVLVLAASCANVATLLMARGVERRREIATRLALGASRGRVIRQLVSEALWLGIGGALLGMVLARWNLELLTTMFPQSSSGYSAWIDPETLKINWPVAAFASALGLVTGVGFGLLPALRSTRLNLAEEFQGGFQVRGGRALSRAGRALVVVQVAVACVLLVGAGLFARTVGNLQSVDLGFNRERVLMFAVDAQSAGYTAGEFSRMHERIAEKLRTLPGVGFVSYSGWPVLTGEGGPFWTKLKIDDASGEQVVCWNQVAPIFAETYEMPIVVGRFFDQRDNYPRSTAMVVNQAFASRYFPEGDIVGREVKMFGRKQTVVGVIRNARQLVTELRNPVMPLVLVPFGARPQSIAHFALKTDIPPNAMIDKVRRAVTEIEPGIALAGVSTQTEQVDWRFFVERMFARIGGFVGVLALGLACFGLAGLTFHVVARRTGEIGVRISLGAQPAQVHRMVLRDALSIVLVGLAVGLASAVGGAMFIAKKLYGVAPFDPVTFAGVALLLLVVSFMAAWLPARRAAKVDPMVALRAE
jgi:predicted permease